MKFTDKEIRKFMKKGRQAEEKYKATKDDDWLRKRDKYNDQVVELRRNRVMNQKNKAKKDLVNQKTDDQQLNEANRQHRRERNEREKVQREKDQKKLARDSRRAELKEMMREKEKEAVKAQSDMIKFQKEKAEAEEEYKNEYIKSYKDKYPESTHSDAQKAFIRDYNRQMELLVFKRNMINYFTTQGMSEEDATERVNIVLNNLMNAKNGDNKSDVTEY